jgi:hypothetical protein
VPFVNLTPHPISIYDDRPVSNGPAATIPPSGLVARVAVVELGTVPSPRSGCLYALVQYGQVQDLPDPRPDTDYIVSLVVALAARDRHDLLAPYQEVRDDAGSIIGCRILQRVA